MKIGAYRIYGAREREAIAEALRERLDRWLKEWGASGATSGWALTLDDGSAAERPEGMNWYVAGVGEGEFVALSIGEGTLGGVSALISSWKDAAWEPIAPDTTGSKVTEEAIVSLLGLLVPDGRGARGGTAAMKRSKQAPRLPGHRHNGVINARATRGEFSMGFALSAGVVAGLLTRRPETDSRRLVPIARAIDDRSVKLYVELGSAELTLSEVGSLEEGDVIRLNRRLDEPIAISLDDEATIARCHLGRSGEHYAVQVAGEND